MPGRPAPWYSRVTGLLAPGGLTPDTQGLRTLPATAWRRVRADAFGAEPTGGRLARIQRSPHFVDGAFRNPVPTRRLVYERSPLEITRAQLASGQGRRTPAGPIPVQPLQSATWPCRSPPACG